MKKTFLTVVVLLLAWSNVDLKAQETITNAFDDLKRTGTVNEQDSEMRQATSDTALQKLLTQKPAAGYFCFAEDRMHDIRLDQIIPARWTERVFDTWLQLKGDCQPGEFYTWQIGVFTPFKELKGVSVSFSDLVNADGNKIKSTSFQCFNQEGTDTDGQTFRKTVCIPKGYVQALWIGMDIPASAKGIYKGKAFVKEGSSQPVEIAIELNVSGSPIANHGDNEGWRKTRLRWLNSTLGNADEPTAPYTPVTIRKKTLSWLGGEIELSSSGLPCRITTCYDANNRLSDSISNAVLAKEMAFIIETFNGQEALKPGSLRITNRNNASISWETILKSQNFNVVCQGTFGFDGISNIRLQVKPKQDIEIKDIRLEVPYTTYASKYMMGLGHKGGFRPDTLISWKWDTDKQQDKILKLQATERFYHSNSDVSAGYIPAALKAGANLINVHHKKDIYPFINYPYYDESVTDLKRFISEAHSKNLGVRLYYTTRELTVKIPELWALRSLGGEVIHDGPGKDTRTLIHRNGPNEWLNKNLATHFIPAWYNAFEEGKYAGDMDISVITTPDSRWNNYYLAGLDWMVKNLGVDGIYIDDSALDRKTLQRARRILDADGKRRLIDIHSWNHMNQWAGYANSLHLYTELLPYIDRTWIGEGFKADNSVDFWLVEMSGIPFGLLSETLDARNPFRGMVFGMLPRLPWSGNPVPLWQLWDSFGMDKATMHGYWDENNPVKTDNANLLATVYTNENKALLVIANWTDLPQKAKISIDEKALGFHPATISLPEIRDIQWGSRLNNLEQCEIMGRSGMIILLEK